MEDCGRDKLIRQKTNVAYNMKNDQALLVFFLKS